MVRGIQGDFLGIECLCYNLLFCQGVTVVLISFHPEEVLIISNPSHCSIPLHFCLVNISTVSEIWPIRKKKKKKKFQLKNWKERNQGINNYRFFFFIYTQNICITKERFYEKKYTGYHQVQHNDLQISYYVFMHLEQ